MNKTISPPYLQAGDMIAIVATARFITPDILLPVIKTINSWGLQVYLHPELYAQENQFAGSDETRVRVLQDLLHNTTVKAILCARGGYGTTRIIDKLDFTHFKKAPKWIIGFSDVTALHVRLNHLGIQSLHSIMPILFENIGAEKSTLSLKSTLLKDFHDFNVLPHEYNRTGTATAELIGGNLSMLAHLMGTPDEIETKGKILFIEDLDEYLYHIDRMMTQLQRGGKINQLAGLIVGHFSDMKDNLVPFGKNALQIIADQTKEFDFPVCFGFPVGHAFDNMTLVCGAEYKLAVTTQGSHLSLVSA